jgi:two-component system chemotaxis response regulator CheY
MKKHHVLIVDDTPEIRSLIVTTLGGTFYHLAEAPNGEQALAYLENHDLPDLVILDLAMPGISGFDVVAEIKGNPDTAHIEVVVLSANADQISPEIIRQLGIRATLMKPFSPLELLQLIESIFD